MNVLYKYIFTPESLGNIEKTGNVWGVNTEYDFNFSINLLGRKISFEQRSKGQLWGRFGGGWNWKVGIQVGGSTIIISLFTMSISIRPLK